ncbi:MAG: hypothetical protein K5663_08125 [Clostridiales bacterium]|nr:hypothetical protein [Clostridiales bacterium]
MKRYIALILACLLLAALPALAETEDVSGEWYTGINGAAALLTLKADGSYTISYPTAETAKGTWRYDDGYIYLDGEDLPALMTIDGQLKLCGEAVFFTRERPATYAPAEVLEGIYIGELSGYWKAAYVDKEGTPLPAGLLEDETDLYVEGTHVILGGPEFGDTIVEMAEENGALSGEIGGAQVLIQQQQDGLLRLSVTSPDAPARVWYLAAATSAALDTDTAK